MATPVLSQVVYSGTQIRANFTYEDQNQQNFQIALFEGTSTTPAQTAPSGPLMAILSNPQMNTTSVWAVAIAAVVGGVVGDYSNRIAVIVGPPQNISLTHDGTAVVLEWSPPAGATVAYGATVSLFNTATGDLLDNATFTSAPGIYRPTGGFNPAISYGIRLAGANTENSYGPYSPLISIIQATPVFSSLNYTLAGGNATIVANSSTFNPDNPLGLYIYADGSLSASAIAAAPGNFVRLELKQPLAPDFTYSAYLAYTIAGGGSRGPLSNALPVVVEPASITAVTYDGATVTASWNNGVGAPPPTGAYVGITNAQGVTVESNDVLGTSASIVPSPPLTANTPYQLSVGAQRGASLGPISAAVNVLTYLPSPSAAATYDGENIGVTWTTTGGSDVTGMNVALLNNGTVVQTQPGGNLQTKVAAALSPNGTYDVALQTTGDRTIGPLGAAIPVISVRPRVTSATYAKSGSTSSVEVKWNASDISSAHGVTGYIVQIYENGAPLGAAVPVTGAATDHVTVNLQSVLDTSKTHTVTVQATGTKSTGPIGIPSPIITASPAIVSVSYDGTNVTAKWTTVGQEGVSGYKVTVGSTTETTSLTSLTFPFTPAAANPMISVLARGATAAGPAASTTLLTSTATVSSTSFDGAMLTVVWSAATVPPAYLVRVLEGTNVVASLSSTSLQATLAAALSASAAYDVVVLPTSSDGTVIGPPSPSLPVISVIPRVTGATYSTSGATSSVDVRWNASDISNGHGVTGYKVQLYENGAALGAAVPVAGSTTDHVTMNLQSVLDTSKSHTVSVQATGANATGPVSAQSPIITASPAFVSISYDGTNVTAKWTPLGQEGVIGYRVSVAGTDHTTSLTSITFAYSSDTNPAISILALGLAATGPPASTTLLTKQVDVKTTSYDGSILKATWQASTPPPAYLVEVLEGTNAVASQLSTALRASLPVALSLPETYNVVVRPASADGIVIGPRSTTAPVIVGTPLISSVAFDTSGSLKIDWDPINGAGRYKVQFSMANVVVVTKNPTTNSLTLLTGDLPPKGIYDVTVQPFASAANDDVSGPVCSPLPAVVLPPPNVGIAYDGRTARVTWEPLASPAITGYLTTILNGTIAVGTATTVGPAASIAVAYAPANNYNVVVQALTSAGKGQPSAQAALFQSAWYPSTAANETSYINPAAAAAMSSYDIVVYLANIFTTYVSSGLPTDPPFVFSTASAPYSYKLTMPGNSAVWTFNADSIRSGIVTAYQTLLSKLVELHVTPLGWRMVQDAISRAMPQTFAETLYYGYAFAPGDGYIDLKPGMLLRADFESYQYLGPDQNVSKFVDGFVSSSSALYDVGSYVTSNDQWLTGFDAFLSQVTQSGSTVPAPQSEGSTSSGGGGIVDLYYSQFRRSFVRLVYPTQLLGDRTAEARTPFNVAVLATNDYPTLATATQNLRNAQPLPNGVAATYLRGRTMLSACIRVWLDDQPLVVPVGTSVGNLLDSMGRRPPIVIPQSGNPGIPLSGILVERSTGYAVTDPNDYSMSKGIAIRLDWNKGMAYSTTTDWLNLPLLPGDRISTRGNE